MGIPEEQTNGEEVLDMCKAMEEIRAEERKKGEIQGRIEGEQRGKNIGKIMAYMDMGVSIEEIAESYMLHLERLNR